MPRLEVAGRCFEGVREPELANLVSDIKDLDLLLRIQPDGCSVSGSAIKDAMARSTNKNRLPRLEPFWKSTFGLQLMATSSIALEKRAGDDLGIKKMGKAIACLRDPTMLVVELGAPEPCTLASHIVVSNMDRVMDLSAVATLTESMCLMVGSLQSFTSNVHIQSQQPVIEEWADQLGLLAWAVRHCSCSSRGTESNCMSLR